MCSKPFLTWVYSIQDDPWAMASCANCVSLISQCLVLHRKKHLVNICPEIFVKFISSVTKEYKLKEKSKITLIDQNYLASKNVVVSVKSAKTTDL